jgi:ABC-type transport system involved in multi-copper enzyme maturation permease subunit
MIWFALRQFRLQAVTAFALLLALAIAFLVTGPHLVHAYNTTIVGCQARGDCNGSTESFLSAYPFLQNLLTESVILAALIGVFWGAPVVAREFDSGTYRLAWTQSASRTQWLTAKLIVGGTASVVTAGLFTLMATWWSSPLDRVRDQQFSIFDTRDIAPIGYALFAFALGVAIGAVVRRTIPTMALTILVFAAVRVCFNQFIRPHFAKALSAVTKFELPYSKATKLSLRPRLNPADWTISSKVENAAGKVFPRLSSGFGFQSNANGSTTFVGAGVCPNKIPNAIHRGGSSGPPKAVQEALSKCVSSFHLTNYLTYQPASRYWMFQWCELGSYVVLSALLVSLSVWWIRRR